MRYTVRATSAFSMKNLNYLSISMILLYIQRTIYKSVLFSSAVSIGDEFWVDSESGPIALPFSRTARRFGPDFHRFSSFLTSFGKVVSVETLLRFQDVFQVNRRDAEKREERVGGAGR